MDGNAIINLKDADSSTPAENAVNKKYVDEGLRIKIDAIAQKDLNMNNNSITNLAPPIDTADAVNKNYVNTFFLRRDGTNPMYGDLDMGSQRITALHDPITTNDAATKK